MTILMKSQCPEDPGRYEHLKEKMSLFLYPERKFLDNTFKTPIFMWDEICPPDTAWLIQKMVAKYARKNGVSLFHSGSAHKTSPLVSSN